jgi:hypothetical protein
MRWLAAILLPASLAACAQVSPKQGASTLDPAYYLPVSEAARAAFARYDALRPQTADPPTAEQAEYFADIERLQRGAREAPTAWSRELFLRTASDQFWRQGFAVATIEKLGLAEAQDVTNFRQLVSLRTDETDRSNTAFLKAEVDRRGGWPPKSEVGEGASHFAWLLVQHADRDPDFQERVLVLMEPMVATGEADGQDFAYLFDRVAVAAHRPQKFGTQGRCVAGEGRWEPREIEDAANVDSRRASVRLGPLASYSAQFAEMRACEGQ